MAIVADTFRSTGNDRWYLLLAPMALVAFLIALFFVGASGQARLEAANVRVHNSEIREQALNDYLERVITAEAGERGSRSSGALDRLTVAYRGSPSTLLDVQRLRELTDLNTPVAKIVALVNALRRTESAELSSATAGWQTDLTLSHRITIAGAVLNIGLVILATLLVYADMGERTQELTTLSTHLQSISEEEKSALSRELHDELGGLLVAARMDLSWLQKRLPTSDPAIEQRYKRIHECLSAGVDLKRRVVEELRPTLLDNMGLFTALRWQFKESCRRAGLECTETIPSEDLSFDPDAAIGVFRIAQEALTNIVKHAEAKSAQLAIELQSEMLVLRVSDDGKGIPMHRIKTSTSHGLASMKHRIQALGGTLSLVSPSSGGTLMTAKFPLSKMLPARHAVSAMA